MRAICGSFECRITNWGIYERTIPNICQTVCSACLLYDSLIIVFPVPTASEKALTSLTDLSNLIASGRAPKKISPFLCGANLIATKTKSGGIRPIAVGEFLRRLVAKCASRLIASSANSIVSPLQLGVATKGGCEAVLHAANHLIHGKPWLLVFVSRLSERVQLPQ